MLLIYHELRGVKEAQSPITTTLKLIGNGDTVSLRPHRYQFPIDRSTRIDLAAYMSRCRNI